MSQLIHNLTQQDYNNIVSINIVPPTEILENNKPNKTEIDIELDLKNINIDDYELAEEEQEYGTFVDILNIFNVYFKTLYGKKYDSTLFDEIDMDDFRSTNRAMEKLYEEIYKYKSTNDERYTKLYDPSIYKFKYLIDNDKLPDDYPLYLIDINETNKVTHNLIPALTYIASFDWKNIEWSINQINEF